MFDLKDYSSNIQMILGPHEAGQRLMPLAPAGPWNGPGLSLLKSASAPQLLSGTKPASEEFAQCVLSALFLYFSALEDSHQISQGIYSSTGSFLHGVMHRQEPDFSNAKYWFRRVPSHDVYPALRQGSLELLAAHASPAAKRLREEIDGNSPWDPHWFVECCQAVQEGEDAELERPLLEIQRLEWQLLFDYCYGRAVRKTP